MNAQTYEECLGVPLYLTTAHYRVCLSWNVNWHLSNQWGPLSFLRSNVVDHAARLCPHPECCLKLFGGAWSRDQCIIWPSWSALQSPWCLSWLWSLWLSAVLIRRRRVYICVSMTRPKPCWTSIWMAYCRLARYRYGFNGMAELRSNDISTDPWRCSRSLVHRLAIIFAGTVSIKLFSVNGHCI